MACICCLLSACLGATGATFFVVQGGWYLAQRRGIEEGAWGGVTAPKYADISCLRVAFEAGRGWLYCEVTGQGFTTAVSHREPVLIQPPPLSTAKYYHRMKTRQETPRRTKAAIMTSCCCVWVPRTRTSFRKLWSTGYQAVDNFYCVRTAVV